MTHQARDALFKFTCALGVPRAVGKSEADAISARSAADSGFSTPR